MASPTADLTAFAQSVYLTIKNRYFDDITGEDGQLYIQQVVDWTNMFLDELENTLGPDGQLVDWWFARNAAYSLGTATAGANSIGLSSAIDHVITDEGRYVQILQDGTPVANFAVVNPRDITNKSDRITEDMCAVVGTSLVFSRNFTDAEANGSIVGDVQTVLPRLTFTATDAGIVTATNVRLLTTVKPKQLLVLGVAKNASLPDIVQGKLSPSFATKFDNLMNGAIARSIASSQSHQISRESFSGVRGVY